MSSLVSRRYFADLKFDLDKDVHATRTRFRLPARQATGTQWVTNVVDFGTAIAICNERDGTKIMSPQCVEAELMRQLARYFRDNPLACDTAEGALRWWLPQESKVSESMVVTALNEMVAQGALETLTAVDGRIRYRRNAILESRSVLDRLAKIETLDDSTVDEATHSSAHNNAQKDDEVNASECDPMDDTQ